MRIVIILIIIFSVSVYAATTTGTKVMGTPTLGQPSYPNSGPLRTRSNDMTGRDMSNATLMGSDVDPTVPSSHSTKDKQEQEEEIQTGPYKDGVYQFWDKNKEEKENR